jgi:hypothetical protein
MHRNSRQRSDKGEEKKSINLKSHSSHHAVFESDVHGAKLTYCGSELSWSLFQGFDSEDDRTPSNWYLASWAVQFEVSSAERSLWDR